MADFRPCPFCGSLDILMKAYTPEEMRVWVKEPGEHRHYQVTCLGCGVEGPVQTKPENAARLWDERVGDNLLGLGGIARLFGVSRQWAAVLAAREEFPAPAQELPSGRAWDTIQVMQWYARGRRPKGRPRTRR